MGKRVNFATTLDEDLLKQIKIIAIERKKKINDVIEEGFKLIIEKYEKEAPGE